MPTRTCCQTTLSGTGSPCIDAGVYVGALQRLSSRSRRFRNRLGFRLHIRHCDESIKWQSHFWGDDTVGSQYAITNSSGNYTLSNIASGNDTVAIVFVLSDPDPSCRSPSELDGTANFTLVPSSATTTWYVATTGNDSTGDGPQAIRMPQSTMRTI